MYAVPPTARSQRRTPLLVLGVGLTALLWAYWPSLVAYSKIWATNPSYSHAYLVPLFALALLWLRRDQSPAGPWRGTYWGWAVVLGGVGLRFLEAEMKFEREYSLLPCLAGICLLVGGWQVWRWVWPSVLFIAFMIPLPWTIEQRMPLPLQTFATETSTFLLQTLGLPAVSDGNNILLSGDKQMEIVEACSGLRMLMIFFALSTAMALIIKRPVWEKVMLVGSAFPIALAANVLRITLTGILREYTDSEWINHLEHDMAGWVMMPMALLMLGAEFRLLQFLQDPTTAQVKKPVKMVARTSKVVVPPARPVASWFPIVKSSKPPAPAKPAVVKQPTPAKPAVVKQPVPLKPAVVKQPTPVVQPAVAAPTPVKPPVFTPRAPARHPVAQQPAPAKQPMVETPSAPITRPISPARPTMLIKPPVVVSSEPPAVAAVAPKPAVAAVPPKPAVAAVPPKPAVAAVPPKPAVVEPVSPPPTIVTAVVTMAVPPAVAPTPVSPTKKVTAAPKPAAPETTEVPATPRRTRKPWQPAKSSVAAAGPHSTPADGAA